MLQVGEADRLRIQQHLEKEKTRERLTTMENFANDMLEVRLFVERCMYVLYIVMCMCVCLQGEVLYVGALDVCMYVCMYVCMDTVWKCRVCVFTCSCVCCT